MVRKRSRKYLTLAVIIVIAALLTYAFWPRPLLVDVGEVIRGHLAMTIDEEGKTRVHDPYVVATPVGGRLLRVTVEPGDPVVGGKSVVAEMLPQNPSILDARSLAEIQAGIKAAQAALQAARSERQKAVADKELADIDLARIRDLYKDKAVSGEELDQALRDARVAEATFQAARSTVRLREAERDRAQAQLISARDREEVDQKSSARVVPIHAPVDGHILRVLHKSESTLPAGTAVLEIGDIESDLEVVVELLSSVAVQVSHGDRVIIHGWGGSGDLSGIVQRIEPRAFTKVSALGVEEQRVNTIIAFTNPPGAFKRLGHGFRIEAKIVIWESEDALLVPSSALFRAGADWAVYQKENGRAHLRHVRIGRNNGIEAEVTAGLELNDRVILYPSAALADGAKVARRDVE